MQHINYTKMIRGLLLIACLVQASHSGAVSTSTTTTPPQLMCYICENCAKITKQTPIEVCNVDFFEKRSSTTQDPNADSSTTNGPMTTTSETTTDNATSEMSNETTTTTQIVSTTEAVPTAPTVGPITTTTAVTPINIGTIPTFADEVNMTVVTMNSTNMNTTDNTTIYNTSSEGPQALPLIADDYTYHCYSVQKTVNGNITMDRGCSRVTTMESVCGQLMAMNKGIPLSKCVPCSNSECNGSSALGISMGVLLFTLVAALLSRH